MPRFHPGTEYRKKLADILGAIVDYSQMGMAPELKPLLVKAGLPEEVLSTSLFCTSISKPKFLTLHGPDAKASAGLTQPAPFFIRVEGLLFPLIYKFFPPPFLWVNPLPGYRWETRKRIKRHIPSLSFLRFPSHPYFLLLTRN